MKLDQECIKAIEAILKSGKHAEVGARKDKIIVWEVQSKKKYENG